MQHEDMNLVEMWLRKDPVRWIAGALAGLFACVLMTVFAMILSGVFGNEVWFPMKVAALPVLGGSATEFGFHLRPILIGLAVQGGLCAFLGVIYAHFTGTNSLPALLGMGFVWGAFSWIFIFNLFVQSFTDVRAANLSPAAAFPIMMVFGLSLTSVAFFDRALRGNAR